MTSSSTTPSPLPADEERKRKTLRIQVGDHLDINVGFYMSPKAILAMSSIAAAAGTWGSGILHQ
jgi:hypothetical protein